MLAGLRVCDLSNNNIKQGLCTESDLDAVRARMYVCMYVCLSVRMRHFYFMYVCVCVCVCVVCALRMDNVYCNGSAIAMTALILAQQVALPSGRSGTCFAWNT